MTTFGARRCCCDGSQDRQGVPPPARVVAPSWRDRRVWKDRYDSDELLQEAGDSLMMKIGEAANRLSRVEVVAPKGVEWNSAIGNRNWLIHQYDEIDRDITWSTLAGDFGGVARGAGHDIRRGGGFPRCRVTASD